jgi:hypothetical protein
MPATYEPIATTTLGTATGSITFSSITSAYTDLRLVFVCTNVSGGDQVKITFNGITGTSYSSTYLYGDGASAGSGNASSQPDINVALIGTSTTIPTSYLVDILSYTGSRNKTIIATANENKNGSGGISYTVGLLRNTAAITSMTVFKSGGTYAVGTIATLYGIKNA